MKKHITDKSPAKGALIVGIAFIASVILVTLVDDFLLPNFVIPGDTAVLARDIVASPGLFVFASIGYLVVLMLDSIIGFALFIVLRPANVKLASLTGTLRPLYAGTLMFGVLALLFQIVDTNGYASIKHVGYIFFAAHIFMLGISVLKSSYIPNGLGVLLIFASFTYGIFFIDFRVPEGVSVLIMIIMASAELVLSIWLMVKRNSLPAKDLQPLAGALS